MSTFLVTGSTGRQGGSTARKLLQKGANVHALVRNPSSDSAKAIESEGAILFEGDIGNATAVSKALDGVTGVFFNPPYPGPESLNAVQIFIETCAKHRDTVTTFVLSTAAGVEKHAQRVREDPHYSHGEYYRDRAAMEVSAKGGGFKHLVILRPSFLMHGYLLPFSGIIFPELAAEKKFVTALAPQTKVPHLRAEDVGTFAAAALIEPERFRGKEINLAAENLTAADVAETIGGIAGVEITSVAPELRDGKAVGVNSPVAIYHQWANEVDASVDVERLKKEFGFELTTLREFLGEQREDFRKSLNVS